MIMPSAETNWEKASQLAVSKGSKANGSITVVGETPIKDWPCKQLEWKLVRGAESITRPGLVCMTYGSSYSGSQTWNTVF